MLNKIQSYVVALVKSPKVQQTVLAAGAYYAGAHAGPRASEFVYSYGPDILNVLVRLLGG